MKFQSLGLECKLCHTTETSRWRPQDGAHICQSCYTKQVKQLKRELVENVRVFEPTGPGLPRGIHNEGR